MLSFVNMVMPLVWVATLHVPSAMSIDIARLQTLPTPMKNVDLTRYGGIWYMQVRFVPCSWGGSKDFSDFVFNVKPTGKRDSFTITTYWRQNDMCASINRNIKKKSSGIYQQRDSIVLTLTCQFAVVLTSWMLYSSGYNLFPVYFDDLPINLHDEPWQARVHAFLEKTTFPGYYERLPKGGFRAKMSTLASIDLIYEMEDKSNVFTKQNLMWMEELENKLINVTGYGDLCQLDLKNGGCTKPISVLRYFDGTYKLINTSFYDPTYDNIAAVLALAAIHPDTKARFPFFLGKGASVREGVSSPITRSVIPFGFPMEKYQNDRTEYRNDLGEYTGQNMEPILLEHMADTTNKLQFTYRSQTLWFNFARRQAFKDLYWVGGSVAFIFCFMLLHTRSLWITGFAIMSVVSSFLVANLLYNLVFQFHYLGFFHILSLFIVLGIGADDFFVFYDIWRNTGSDKYISVAHRLSDAYRRSSMSMLFTSITTSVAFFANTISPLLATRSFGLFAGIVVIVNYLSVVTFFPTVIAVYHHHFENWQWPCFRCCSKHSGKKLKRAKSKEGKDTEFSANAEKQLTMVTKFQKIDSEASTECGEIVEEIVGDVKDTGHVNTANMAGMNLDDAEKNDVFTIYNGEIEPTTEISQDENGGVPKSEESSGKKPLMARFFGDIYFAVVTHKYVRWVILLLMTVVLGFFIFKASKIEADNDLFGALPDDHQYSIATRHKLDSFMASYGDETLSLYMVWGLKQNDMSRCNFSEPQCNGELVMDETFDLSSEESQIALKAFCDTLENMDDTRANRLRLRKNTETQKYEIRCFLNNMDEFFRKEGNMTGHYLDFPYTKDKVLQFMTDRPQFYNVSRLSDNFKEYLQIPLSYWLSHRYTYDVTDDFKHYDSLIGEQKWTYSLPLNSDSSKLYANKIRYAVIEVNTTMKFRILGHEEGIPIRREWENFMAEELAKMPIGLQNGFQTDRRFRWHWLSVQEMLIQNAVNGLIIGVCVAFPILIIATGNVIIGSLATLSLCACTVCVIGVIPLGGWKLGVLESLNMCMVVGLSVDYVVHLAQAYSSSLHTDRLSRTRDMLDEMATPVFFGAITTLGAAMFMFFTVLVFFKQFATFLFATIGFSLLFSMCMFTTLMAIIGPQNNTGNLKSLFQNWFKREN